MPSVSNNQHLKVLEQIGQNSSMAWKDGAVYFGWRSVEVFQKSMLEKT